MLKQPDATASVCRLDPNQVETDAGGSFSVHATVTCADQRDLAGLELVICSPDGQEVGSGTCSRGESGHFGLRIENVPAPVTPGIFAYTLCLVDADDRSVDMKSATLDVTVRPHLTRVTVWDAPPALRPGERFSFLVGVKCSSSCCLEGRAVQVTDEAGTHVAAERLGSNIWPGTERLHVARVQATAPEAVGCHAWRITSPSGPDDVAHESGTCDVRVTVTDLSDCAVEVSVVELATERALSQATVVLHPFRAVTDTKGIARLDVAKGEYDLLVSCSRHMPSATRCSVMRDEAIRIVLAPEGLWTPVEEA
jgi:hypothetical protein